MKRRLFKWLLRLFMVGIALVVILLLSRNAILRVVIQHNIRSQTGMNAEVGSFKLGLTTPTIEIKDLKIYNPPGFGSAPFLDIAEIHAEYDRDALLKKQFHLTLVRFNLAELDIVKSQDGRTNFFELAKSPPTAKATPATPQNFREQTGYEFEGIDSLRVSFGKVKFIDLQTPGNSREQDIALQDCVVPKVKSATDLAGLILLIDLRSNHFFDSLVAKPQNSTAIQGIFNILQGQ
jgi:uncharacterized protein involved in outer membrane biogenesis